MGYGGSVGGAAFSGYYSGAAVHHFDTGLYRSQREVVLQAIINRLAETMTKAKAGRYVSVVRALPRPLKNDGEEELGMLFYVEDGQRPSLLVALGRRDDEEISMDGESTRGDLEVVVYAISGNQRGLLDGRLEVDITGANDPTKDPGVWTMLEHVDEALLGQGADVIGMAVLTGKYEDEVATLADCSVWERRYSVYVSREIKTDRAETGLITSIEVNHNLDGLPDSAQPFVDTITTLEVP